MDTTRACLTPTGFGLIQVYVCTKYCEVNRYCSSSGSRTRTIIVPLSTHPASPLYRKRSAWRSPLSPLSYSESHVIFIPSGLQVRTRPQLRLTRYKRRDSMSISASEQFHPICQTTHHTITPMDFFFNLLTITSNTSEAETEPATPIDAGGGNNGGCIVA